MMSSGGEIPGYTILRRIGAGGMGEVFLARHRVLQRLVAIKVLLPEVVDRPELASRFIDEARAAAAIDHPAIVHVYDCGFLPGDRAYIVLEYLHGLNLGEALAQWSPLRRDANLATAIIGEIAEGLFAAHERGIVHRDVKPENIFLSRKPQAPSHLQIKILDFGIAKLLQSDRGALTETGTLLGTPQYMSPEQCRGEHDIDHRADIYALGCLAFELLAGRPVFETDTIGTALIAQATQPAPSLVDVMPAVPPNISRMIDRMLAKDRKDRPATMGDVVNTVARHLGCAPGAFSSFLQAPPHVPLGDDGAIPDDARNARAAPARQQRKQPEANGRKPGRNTPASFPLAKPRPETPFVGSKPPASLRLRGFGRRRPRPGWALAGLAVLSLGAVAVYRSVREETVERSAAAQPHLVTPLRKAPTQGAAPGPADGVPPGDGKERHASDGPAAQPGYVEVRVTSNPAGAEVWLDEGTRPRGVTPLTVSLPVGAKRVLAVLRLTGYAAHALALSPEGGKVFSADLRALESHAPDRPRSVVAAPHSSARFRRKKHASQTADSALESRDTPAPKPAEEEIAAPPTETQQPRPRYKKASDRLDAPGRRNASNDKPIYKKAGD